MKTINNFVVPPSRKIDGFRPTHDDWYWCSSPSFGTITITNSALKLHSNNNFQVIVALKLNKNGQLSARGFLLYVVWEELDGRNFTPEAKSLFPRFLPMTYRLH